MQSRSARRRWFRWQWLALVAVGGCLYAGGTATGYALAGHAAPATPVKASSPVPLLSAGTPSLFASSPSVSPTVAAPSAPASEAPSASAIACQPPWAPCTASSAIGNFEGSGVKEMLTASPVLDQSGTTVGWTLSVRLASGATISAALHSLVAAQNGCPALPNIEYARVRGAAGFDGPSRDLALVEVSSGASTKFAILVGLQGGTLQLATVASGAERCQRLFLFGGSVTHGNGLTCGWHETIPVLWVQQVSDNPPTDYTDYSWYRATYSWQGLKLYLQRLEHDVITSSDPRFAPSYSVLCGSINIPD